MNEFTSGSFSFEPFGIIKFGSVDLRRWELSYGGKLLADRRAPASATQDQVREVFCDDIRAFNDRARKEHASDHFHLIDYETGDAVAAFAAHYVPEMTPGLVDDRSRYWIRSVDRLYSRPTTLSEFAALAAAHQAPHSAWIAGLLSEEVLTDDPQDWRAPTSWELRHVVGEGSFTGVPGAKAAALVGVLPQNFRKYTAADGAASRQNMSFAMWHLLLAKLQIKTV